MKYVLLVTSFLFFSACSHDAHDKAKPVGKPVPAPAPAPEPTPPPDTPPAPSEESNENKTEDKTAEEPKAPDAPVVVVPQKAEPAHPEVPFNLEPQEPKKDLPIVKAEPTPAPEVPVVAAPQNPEPKVEIVPPQPARPEVPFNQEPQETKKDLPIVKAEPAPAHVPVPAPEAKQEAPQQPVQKPEVKLPEVSPAVKLVQNDDVAAVREMIYSGKTEGLFEQDENGRIPLHFARSNEMATLLWDRYVRVKISPKATEEKWSPIIPDRNGMLPMHVMAQDGQKAALNTVLYHWCTWWQQNKINAKDGQGRTILHLAAINGDAGLVRELLGCKYLSLNARDKEGRTALHHAAMHKDFAAGLVLTATQAFDPKQKDNFGASALSLVHEQGNTEAETILAQ